MKRIMLLFVVILFISTGCATRIMVPYNVKSTPPSAPVEVNGVRMGNTPVKITLGTTKRWVGVCVGPGGWAYTNESYLVTVYPPSDIKEKLYSCTK